MERSGRSRWPKSALASPAGGQTAARGKTASAQVGLQPAIQRHGYGRIERREGVADVPRYVSLPGRPAGAVAPDASTVPHVFLLGMELDRPRESVPHIAVVWSS